MRANVSRRPGCTNSAGYRPAFYLVGFLGRPSRAGPRMLRYLDDNGGRSSKLNHTSSGFPFKAIRQILTVPLLDIRFIALRTDTLCFFSMSDLPNTSQHRS